MTTNYIKFILSRLLGTGIDTLVLWLFASFVFTSYFGQYIIAPTISFEVATFTNFLFSYYWIWNDRIGEKGKKTFMQLFIFFNVSCILAFLVKMGFLLLFEKIFGWDVVVCNIVALLISGLVNFWLSEFVVFKDKSTIAEVPVSLNVAENNKNEF